MANTRVTTSLDEHDYQKLSAISSASGMSETTIVRIMLKYVANNPNALTDIIRTNLDNDLGGDMNGKKQ